MSKQIRVGLIGCGSLSQIGVLPQLSEADARERVDLVAVCDTVAARAVETARAYGVPHALTSPDELIARDDIDLVLVITPIGFHHSLALKALHAGKHVYVQKTMTTTYGEAKELVDTARERGLVLVSAPGQMLAPAMRAMRSLVTSGALGDVYWAWGSTGGWQHHLEANRQGDDARSSADPSWYYSKSGGPLRDVTVYVLHSLTGILGPAKQVAAMSGIRTSEHRWRDKVIPVEIDDNTILTLNFGDATFAMLGGHSAATGRLIQWGGMGIYGSRGSVEALEIEPLSGHPISLAINGEADFRELEPVGSDTYTLRTRLPHVTDRHAAIPEPHVYADIMHCVDCIQTGASPVASGEHAAPRGRDYREGVPGGEDRPGATTGEHLLCRGDGSGRRDRVTRKLKVAVLGCGDVSQRDYLPEMHRLEDRVELVAVCGRSEARARSVAEQYGIDAWYTDYHQMLGQSEAEAVINLTPIQLHAETTLASLQAGKHVYCEKPVATTVADAAQLREAASDRGLVLVCAPSILLYPQVREARSLLERRAIGSVHSAVGQAFGGVPPWVGYTSDPSQFFAKGAGPVADMGVYPLHVVTGLFGPARRVSAMAAQAQREFLVADGPAQGKVVPIEVADTWHLLLQFENDLLVTILSNNSAVGSRGPQLELFGLEGTIALNLLDVSAPLDLFQSGEWRSLDLPHERSSGPDHLLGVQHLVDCVDHHEAPMLSVDHAIHVLEIIEAADTSARLGQRIELMTCI